MIKTKFKEIFLVLLVVLVALILVSCNNSPSYGDISKERTIKTDFMSLSKEYTIENSQVDLFYLKDDLNPYIDLVDYISMLEGLYYSNEFEFISNLEDEKLSINLMVEFSDNTVYNFKANLDFKEDIINVDSLDFFAVYLVKSEIDYSKDLINLPSIITNGSAITYNLADYNFDMFIKNDKFYLPLSIANLLFNQDVYFDVYYNGETLYGIDSGTIEDDELKKILKSKYNNEVIHSSVSMASYNFYEFIIDYFYGLKNDRDITSGKTFLSKYKDALQSKDTTKTIFEVTEYMDDLHTSHLTRGYYNNKRRQLSYKPNYQGPNIKAFYNGVSKVQKDAIDNFGIKNGYIDFTDYEILEDNKTAVIYIMNFELDTPEYVEGILKTLETKGVTDVVIDLAFNTGGNLGAVLRVLTLMTDQVVSYHSKNPLDNATDRKSVV